MKKEQEEKSEIITNVLPWHFKEEILIREKETMENGTKMIFPLPTLEIYP